MRATARGQLSLWSEIGKMIPMIRRYGLWTSLAVALAASAAGAKPIDLAPHFETGAVTCYLSRSVIDHRVEVELADVDEQVRVTTEAGMSLRVVDVASNGAADLEWTLHHVAIATDRPLPGLDAKLDYDSRVAGTASSPLAALFAPLLAKPMAVTVDADGKVMRFAAPDAGDPLNPLATLVRSMFSAPAFEQLPLFITAGAPRPAPFRSEWTSRASVELPLSVGSLELEQRFRFERISPRRRLARIRMTGKITQAAPHPRAGGGVAALAPQSLLTVEDGKIQGVYQWDYAGGRIASAESTIELTSTLNSVLGPMKLTQESMTALETVPPRELGLPTPPTPQPSATPAPEKTTDDDGRIE